MSLVSDWLAYIARKPVAHPAESGIPNVAGLIYDGFLPLEVADYIRRSEYHHWVEILISSESDPETRVQSKRWRGFCDAFQKWADGPDGLVLYDCSRDNDWGTGKESYKSRCYCMYGHFWGFKSEGEHARFCARFGPELVNPKPFKTVLFG